MNCRVCGSELPVGALFCGECGSSVTAVRRTRVRDTRPSDTTVLESLSPAYSPPGPRPTVRSVPVPYSSYSPAAPVQKPANEAEASTETLQPVALYTLLASTGERVTVRGSGLLGRRPMAQPGEQFDQFVTIADRGRSVSKTHLEFGLESDVFWICDRYSANGTAITAPGGRTRLCEPGRRYRVERGARVELGDQYLDVR